MNFIKNRYLFMILSLIIIVSGLVMFFIKGLNYGIDFTGGTLIQVSLDEFVEADEIREIINDYDSQASILHAGLNKEQVIIKSNMDLTNTEITKIIEAFIERYDLKEDNFMSEKFGASMGKEIRKRALLSIGIASILMLVYITIRFELKFGLSAIIALIHDLLIMLALYSILRIPVNSSFIAAILTILGYSINDTIVIFDRIRENLRLYPSLKLEDLINKSIKESMTRTINTSITTLGAVLVIYILGVEDIKILALPLMIGIIAGTYSSLFVASPLWFGMRKRGVKDFK